MEVDERVGQADSKADQSRTADDAQGQVQEPEIPSAEGRVAVPGTEKTLLARALAAQTKTSFLNLAGLQLVRDAFALAIIFIDELDAIEVQRTMLELLYELDGFGTTADIKLIAATNLVDILDPSALLWSGRLDCKIEFPYPKEEVSPGVNFEGLARPTDNFNGALCKAVCVGQVVRNKTDDGIILLLDTEDGSAGRSL